MEVTVGVHAVQVVLLAVLGIGPYADVHGLIFRMTELVENECEGLDIPK